MKTPIKVPCGWCQQEFIISTIRAHFAKCPKRPPAAQAMTRTNWREMFGRRVAEIDELFRQKHMDIRNQGSPWFQAFEISWNHLRYIYETKIRPKPADPPSSVPKPD